MDDRRYVISQFCSGNKLELKEEENKVGLKGAQHGIKKKCNRD